VEHAVGQGLGAARGLGCSGALGAGVRRESAG
jgi:hypothetical protein